MEHLNPTLKLCLTLIRSLESSGSISLALDNYINDSSNDLIKPIEILQKAWHENLDYPKDLFNERWIYRRHIFLLIWRGFEGQNIYQSLLVLKDEIIEAVKNDLELQAAKLPFKLLMPLLLLQVPAIFILLFGPLLADMLRIL